MYHIRADIPGNLNPVFRSQYRKALDRLMDLLIEQADQYTILSEGHATFRFDLSLRNAITSTGEINIRVTESGHTGNVTHLYYYIRHNDGSVEIKDEHEQPLDPDKVLKQILLNVPRLL